eukprot:Pgem_evm1s18072
MLIETAEFIPNWLQPKVAENRIFINAGNLHIIPVPKTPAEFTIFPPGIPTIKQ